jgi:hypothetical protein
MRRVLIGVGLLVLATGCAAQASGLPGSAPVFVPGETTVTTMTSTPPPTIPPTPTTTQPPVAPCTDAVACVSLSTKQAWLVRNGQVVYGPVTVMPGKADGPTPVGRFRVQWKDQEHYSSEFDNAPMPNSVFFAAGGVAFHAGSLETASHGCVHLSDADSLKFFNELAVGDRVQVLA